MKLMMMLASFSFLVSLNEAMLCVLDTEDTQGVINAIQKNNVNNKYVIEEKAVEKLSLIHI